MGLRRKLYELLGGDQEPEPVTSTEPTEIGYVPLWRSHMLATLLCDEGFHAHVVEGIRSETAIRVSPSNMAHIYVPANEATAARARLDELTAE